PEAPDVHVSVQDRERRRPGIAWGGPHRQTTLSTEEAAVADLPIVCTLQPEELNARAMALLPGVAKRARARVVIDGGYRLGFDASSELLRAIVEMIDAERQCCRFLRFRLTVEPDGDSILLD